MNPRGPTIMKYFITIIVFLMGIGLFVWGCLLPLWPGLILCLAATPIAFFGLCTFFMSFAISAGRESVKGTAKEIANSDLFKEFQGEFFNK